MVSSRPVPWYDRPARPFPALVWLRARYPFLVPPSVFARMAASAAAPTAAGACLGRASARREQPSSLPLGTRAPARGQRVFPVKAWQARRWAGG
jgi:hypothetical protein